MDVGAKGKKSSLGSDGLSAMERIEDFSENYGLNVESLAFYDKEPISMEDQAFEIIMELLIADSSILSEKG